MDLPIALRRTRRSTSELTAVYNASDVHSTQFAVVTTPRKPRGPQKTKKRVRLSDPGPSAATDSDSLPVATTGLTPVIRRTSLTTSKSASTRRRHSTPARRTSGHGMGLDLDSPSKPHSGQVTFLPLRQVLDGRVKRRIRRNGLSEEMNIIHAEKRRRAAAAKAELDQLHLEVSQKDAEIQRLQQLSEQQQIHRQLAGSISDENDDTIVQDNDRITELEREVSELRQKLAARRVEDTLPPITPDADRTYNWTMAARDPFGSTIGDSMHDDNNTSFFMMSPAADLVTVDDDAFGDSTLADLQCSTPSRPTQKKGQTLASGSFHNSNGEGSFPTPPATSPVALTPTTPNGRFVANMLSPIVSTSLPAVAHAEMQADLSDHEERALRHELASMEREMGKLTASLETYHSLLARLDTQLPPADGEHLEGVQATQSSKEDASAIEARVTLLLRSLSDKTSVLADLSNGLSGLGFPGGDASDIVTSLAATFRTARLELEYLTPGEITLPLTAPGARVLDLLLEKLRSLARQVRESDEQIDEYHEIERSLRQQLGSRVDTMDGLVRDVASREARIAELEAAAAAEDAKSKASLAERDERIAELEIGLDRLKGAMASYARDIAELEELVRRLEKSLGEKDTTLAERDAAVASLETKLAVAIEQAGTLRAEKKIASERATEAAFAAEGSSRLLQQTPKCEETFRETLRKAQEIHRQELQTRLQQQRQQVQQQHDAVLAGLNQVHGRALALRDARVSELRSEIEQINASLRAAHDTARRLRLDNAGLGARLDAEKHKAQDAVTKLQAELARVGRMGQDLLLSPASSSLRPPGLPLSHPEVKSLGQSETAPKAATGRRLLALGRQRSSGNHSASTTTSYSPTDTASDDPRLGLFSQPAKRRSNGAVEGEEDAVSRLADGSQTAKRRRRRYDSGLGFLDEEADELGVL